MTVLNRILASVRARVSGHREHHHTIAGALVLATSLLFLAKLAGLAKEMMVAMRFGTGTVADVYALALMFALWPVSIWTAVLSSVLIPTLVKLDDASPSEGARFRTELFGFSLISAVLVGALICLAFTLGMRSGVLDLSPEARRVLGETAFAFCTVTTVGMLSAVLTSQLLAARNQYVSLIDGLPSLCVVAILLFSASAGPGPLMVGTACGFVVQFIVLSLVQPKHLRLKAPRFSMRSTAWSHFWRSVGVLVTSQAMLSATAVIDQVAMTGLGDSANAILGYANRIVLLIMSLISLAVSRAILPVLSRAGDDRAKTWNLATTWSMALFGLALIAALAAAVAAPLAVRLLFERGSFTAEDTRAVSEALRYGLVQIPFFCAGMVMVQYVAATQRYSLFLWGNGVNLVIKLAANAMLIPSLGVPGAMLATALMYAGSMTFLWIFGRPGRGASGQAAGVA